MKRLHRNTSAALSSVLALSAAASIAHANNEESDECEEKEEDAEGQEEDACPDTCLSVGRGVREQGACSYGGAS